MKIAEIIKNAYQNPYMFIPAEFLTLETSRGTISSIVWASTKPIRTIIFKGIDFRLHQLSTG